MPTPTKPLTTAVEGYFTDLHRVRASGGGTGERSYYPALANLIGAVGRTLKPKVFCVLEGPTRVPAIPTTRSGPRGRSRGAGRGKGRSRSGASSR